MDEDDNSHTHHRHVPSLDLRHLKVLSCLGRGAKGVVFLVRTRSSHDSLALKVISKSLIQQKKNNCDDGSEYKRICFERDVLSRLQHPLLPKLKGVIDTENIVGYAIDYCPGRDLHSLRKKQTEKTFSDDIIRFYAAELVLALDYLHKLGIVYRDLKPENIMIQENGHLMLVDFDLSTKLPPRSPKPSQNHKTGPRSEKPGRKTRFSIFQRCCNSGISQVEPGSRSGRVETDSAVKSNSFVGTEEYVAPEIILGNGHDFAVDWWSLGVVLYEMLYGTTPFRGSDRKETFYRILSKSPDLVGEATPLRDLIGKLLEKDAKERITVDEIKGHDFFRGVEWVSLVQIVRPPYIPVGRECDEDMEGITDIDVELFVRGIFDGGDVVDVQSNQENVYKGVGTEVLHHPTNFDNFSTF